MRTDLPAPIDPADDRESVPLVQVDEWIREAQRGSSSAVGRVLESARKYLLLMANRAMDADLRRKVAASDVVQDTFVHAGRDFDKFRGKTEQELFAWLTAILEHRISTTARRYRTARKRTILREATIECADDALARVRDTADTPGTALMARDEELRIRQAIEKLSGPMREVLIERTWRRTSFVEIGQRRGISADGARKLWGRAVRQLRKFLDEGEST